MRETRADTAQALVYALALHALLFALMFLGLWWTRDSTPQDSWEKDARAHFTDFPAYRSLSWVDANYRTRWLWPRRGNEDAIAFLQHRFKRIGVEDALAKAGARNGDEIRIVGRAFEFESATADDAFEELDI